MWTAIDPRWLLAAALIYGWFWGSFLNQLVDRLAPRRTPAPARGRPVPAAAAARPVTLLHPARSVCLACGRRVPWHENLPILSYLLLRGRCRACGASIGLRTLLVELATPLAFGALAWLWGLTGWGAAWLFWAWGAASWLLLALPMTLERRAAARTLAGLAALLAGWAVTIYFLSI